MDQKTAVVTGAARGIGLATADLFLEMGWRVVMVDRDAEALEAEAGQRQSVRAVHCDVSDPDAVTAMAEAAAHGVVGVPVIAGKARPLRFARWEPGAEMRDGPFGARIPVREEPVEPEILIVPLVAFDLRGNRLGYGGGFYDRTLARLRARRATLAIGFAYDAQEAEDLPLEPTDERLDMVVTESRVLVMS